MTSRLRLAGVVPYLLLFVSACALYLKSAFFDFIPTWDDVVYVIENPYIRGFSPENLKGILTKQFLGNYAPLHILSYAIDYAFWGLNPMGYHITNIVLHGLNSCLAFMVVRMITGRQGIAFAASLLFAVHPLNIENVAWISERKSLLATLFFFLSFVSYLKFRKEGNQRHYLMSLILFVLAVLSKSSVVILPLLLAAYELIFRKNDRRLLHLLPFALISIAGGVLVFTAHLRSESIGQDILTADFLFGTVYPTVAPLFWKYVYLLIRPFNLSGYYDTTIYHSFLQPPVLLSLAGWIAATVLIFLKGGPQVRFWFLWFWICLLPVSNIIPIPVYYADRYMYTPGIGFFVLLAMIVDRFSALILSRRGGLALAGCIIIPTVILYSVLSYQRLDVWRNELVFWEDTARKSPNQYKARLNLGIALEKEGRLAEAEKECLAAIAVYRDMEAVSILERIRLKMRLARSRHNQTLNCH
ncbi:MAG: glycosyltransferase family 39 protein [Nitrospirae bacterium]|nr:glycosyltransferase family 39 protein [Nitrospirota bacterium]